MLSLALAMLASYIVAMLIPLQGHFHVYLTLLIAGASISSVFCLSKLCWKSCALFLPIEPFGKTEGKIKDVKF